MADGAEPIVGNAFDVFVSYARENASQLAAAIIQATGYHRRDGELAALRSLLDALSA